MLLTGDGLLMDNDITSYLREDPQNWWVDRMYLQEAWNSARRSTDPSTQVGCSLVVPNGLGVVLCACNGVPHRLRQAGYPVIPQQKNYCTEHAEREILYSALINGLPTENLTLYCTWATCAECSRAIIRFGISRVVTLTALVNQTPDRWKDSIKNGLIMLRDSGIQVVGWRGDLGVDTPIIFDSKSVWNKDLL